MEFDNDNLKPTYIFKQGLPGSSYAFEVAERIGFDKKFTSLAKNYLDQNKTKIESFLVELEKKSKDLQYKLNNLELENARLKGLTNLYQQQIEKLEKRKKEILVETKNKADGYLKDINKRIETAIKQIKESKGDKTIIKEERKKISKAIFENENLLKEEINENIENYEFKIGSLASIKNTATNGIITEIDTLKNEAVLNSGTIKLRVKLSELIPLLEKKKHQQSDVRFNYTVNVHSYRLDIRGKKPEEAEFEVVRYIDDAYSSGLSSIEILHGKGTGALKKMVQDILKKHEAVKNYHY